MTEKEALKLYSELSSKYRLKVIAVYSYDLSKEQKSKAVRFVYLLKGRKGDSGIIKEFSGEFIAPGCFIVPLKKDPEMKEIFEYWKVPYKRRVMLTC